MEQSTRFSIYLFQFSFVIGVAPGLSMKNDKCEMMNGKSVQRLCATDIPFVIAGQAGMPVLR
jgi:hypothetical protein